jgi:hypothetical protein
MNSEAELANPFHYMFHFFPGGMRPHGNNHLKTLQK